MRWKSALGADLVVVPHADPAPAHPGRVMIAREREMMAGVEPAVVGVAEAVEGADVDHGADLAVRELPSSVTPVTGRGLSAILRRNNREARMTGILDKFHVEHGIYGARV